jgi:hypothetical protein
MAMIEEVDPMDAVDRMEIETAPNVSAPIANLTTILQLHEENRNALGREDTIMSPFATNVDCSATSSGVVSPTSIRWNSREGRIPLLQQPSIHLYTVVPTDKSHVLSLPLPPPSI